MEVLDYVEMPGKVWLYVRQHAHALFCTWADCGITPEQVQGTATVTKTGESYNNRYFFTFEIAEVEGQLRIVRSREMFDSHLAMKAGILGP